MQTIIISLFIQTLIEKIEYNHSIKCLTRLKDLMSHKQPKGLAWNGIVTCLFKNYDICDQSFKSLHTSAAVHS